MSQRTAWIERARPAKNRVDPFVPYAFLVEDERSAAGLVEPTATLFLTNRECPFRCLMCDLWKNTTDYRVPAGAVPAQIDYALARLPPARHVKLYNSGNFFDAQAIPPDDWPAIASRVAGFQTTIVENHPRLCGDGCPRFRDLLACEFEIALGLETVNPLVLAELNKGMTVGDFDAAARFLIGHGIHVRAFVLLRPPYLTEAEGVEWAVKSIVHAFDQGARCVSVIPVRDGNGALERLRDEGRFAPPSLAAMEQTLAAGILLGRGRVFVDLWDARRFAACPRCAAARIERLAEMNLRQKALPPVACECEAP